MRMSSSDSAQRSVVSLKPILDLAHEFEVAHLTLRRAIGVLRVQPAAAGIGDHRDILVDRALEAVGVAALQRPTMTGRPAMSASA